MTDIKANLRTDRLFSTLGSDIFVCIFMHVEYLIFNEKPYV
jgi:hypothetical protein